MAQQPAAERFIVADFPDSQQFFTRVSQPRSRHTDTAMVDRLLRQMTLKEKVGQMTQLEIGMVSTGVGTQIRIDPAKLHKAVVEYGVGSILNVNDETLPPKQWHQIIRAIQDEAARTRLHIPVLYGIDSIHGANYVTGATMFPQPIGMAATWDPEIALRGARITAGETRSAAIPWNFSPVLDIGRQPLWPRLYETYGEDPYLAEVMGVATVRGYEGDDVASPHQVAACLKHYVGYSGPYTGHDRTPALLPENTLREYYLPTFASAVHAGARSVMVNSSEVNGIPGHANHYLLTTVLRKQLGFDGLVVSDWEDIRKLVSSHHVAADEKEATRIAVVAGIDMSMVPSSYSFSDLLLQLVQEGKVPMSRINEAVRRILQMKADLGLFRDPMMGINDGPIGTPASREVSLQAARESITLLQNAGNILPLARNTHVLVTGPTADSLASLNNGWTYTWQGDRASAYPQDRDTILSALRRKLGEQNVAYVPGTDLDKEIDIGAAVSAAQQTDVIILCLGEGAYAETPGNIDDLSLSPAQIRLALALANTRKPVVLVLAEGRPRLINEFADAMRAIVLAYNPSNEGGTAIADILFGDVNPSGRLPYTYPRFPNALLTYDHKVSEDTDTSYGQKAFRPQFEFGFGLSYTTFQYSGLRLASSSVPLTGKLPLSVTVTNTGARPGAEVVQLYVRKRYASVTPPTKRLKRFAKIWLEPGESRELSFTLVPDDLSFIGADDRPTIEPGGFDVMVGPLSAPFNVTAGSKQAPARTRKKP
jgi:beta-glucosidase